MKKLTAALPVAVQAAGLVAFMVGLLMLAGLAWSLLVGGGVLVTLGTLREAGRV